jgi:alcohol dehydrogenase (cytochrome c)
MARGNPRRPAGVTLEQAGSRTGGGLLVVAVVLSAGLVGPSAGAGPAPPEVRRGSDGWPAPNANLASTRAVLTAGITAATVDRLRVRWRFRFRGAGGRFGLLASTPVVSRDTVYVQDTKSSVFALDRDTGELRWARIYSAPNDGPNGVAVGYGRVYAATDTTAFALDARSGRRLWSRRLADRDEQFVDIAPVVASGRVYLSTVGFPPGGRGALYALDARSGRVLWRFDTIRAPWRHSLAGGGGAWYPVSVDGAGRVYAGISNPGPWGGTTSRPNGGVFPGPVPYTNSLVVLEGPTGRLLWHDQVTPHDVRDYDFQDSPILATIRVGGRPVRSVFGAGKAGRVVAWNRTTGRRLWSRAVGTHLRDLGPLPARPVRVCPGFLGGVLTPMAYADGRLFVPVVELCTRESSVRSFPAFQRAPEDGRGVLYALDAANGRTLWSRGFGSPLFGCATVASDVVFAPTYDGRIHALSVRDGTLLWRAQASAGINGCPAVAGNLLIVGAGAPHADHPAPVAELIAYVV